MSCISFTQTCWVYLLLRNREIPVYHPHYHFGVRINVICSLPFRSLMTDVFPGINYAQSEMEGLKKIVADVCREKHLVCGLEEEECGHSWTEKVRSTVSYLREVRSYLAQGGPSEFTLQFV